MCWTRPGPTVACKFALRHAPYESIDFSSFSTWPLYIRRCSLAGTLCFSWMTSFSRSTVFSDCTCTDSLSPPAVGLMNRVMDDMSRRYKLCKFTSSPRPRSVCPEGREIQNVLWEPRGSFAGDAGAELLPCDSCVQLWSACHAYTYWKFSPRYLPLACQAAQSRLGSRTESKVVPTSQDPEGHRRALLGGRMSLLGQQPPWHPPRRAQASWALHHKPLSRCLYLLDCLHTVQRLGKAYTSPAGQMKCSCMTAYRAA